MSKSIPKNKLNKKLLADQEAWQEAATLAIAQGQTINHPYCAEAKALDDFLAINPDIQNHLIEASQLIDLQKEIQVLQQQQKELWVENAVVQEMNKRHAVIRIDGQTNYMTIKGDGTGFTYESKHSFKNYYEASLVTLPSGKQVSKADIWIKNPLRRQYEEVVFIPTTDQNQLAALNAQGKFNIFRGYAVQPQYDTGIKLKIWDHVKDNICSGNQAYYEYLRKWLALVFQKPHQIHTAIIIIGKQETGKNLFVESFGRLLGHHFISLSDLSGLIGQFDFHLITGVLILVSESEWGKDTRAMAKVKSRITDKAQSFEPKGRDRISVNNYMHLILCSNSRYPVHLESDDRRFFVTEVSAQYKGNRKYFKDIVDELDNGGAEILLADLLGEDLNGFEPRDIPNSYTKFDVKMEGAPSTVRYILEVLKEGHFGLSEGKDAHKVGDEVFKHDVYKDYVDWCRENGEQLKPLHREALSKAIKEHVPSTDLNARKRLGLKQARIYKLPDLESARREFCKAIGAHYEDLFAKDKHDESV